MRRLLILVGVLGACSSSTDKDGVVLEDHLVQGISDAAETYTDWDLVGPHVLWSPTLCSAPPLPTAHYSNATGDQAHAQKLYALYSNQAEAYLTMDDEDSSGVPIGTALVKEAFAPVECAAGEAPGEGGLNPYDFDPNPGYVPFTKRDGKTYRTGEALDRFIMLRMPDDTPGTMEGWAFGTVSPNGEVTSAGAVPNCIACHQNAAYDGLFGPKE